ncbi:MAG: PIG-L family deacetylase [Bacteroidales bacterium]|nr:PIG-L family deacetylase [Bacteroidales bacterium]
MIPTSDFAKHFEKMPVNICKDSSLASKQIADEIIDTIKNTPKEKKCVLCFEASSVAIPIYEILVNEYKKGNISFKNVVFFSKNEYYPLDRNELQSHYRFLKEYLFDNIDVLPENIKCLNSTKKDDIKEYCNQYEKDIVNEGGIDIFLTSNMGFNQSGSQESSTTRIVTLNYTEKLSAASDFFGVEYVPLSAITIGMGTILSAKKIICIAWGESSAGSIQKMIEGNISEHIPSSFLQKHNNVQVYIDEAAASELTRVKTPWLVGDCIWTDYLKRKAVFWLCRKLEKPILKLTNRDYNDNQLGELVTLSGTANALNIKVFNDLQHTITGWPGGKPNADDSTRPEREKPFPKRVIVFSPHPDDDVISMGGTVARLSEHGHELHMAYEVSGNIAVFDHDVIKYLDTFEDTCKIYPALKDKQRELHNIYENIVNELSTKHPGESDSKEIMEIKSAIRRGEASLACRYLGIPENRIHFLNLPFYETGGVKKNPLGAEDVSIVKKLICDVKPHQIFAAGDLTDPHGTHRVCFDAIVAALEELKDEEWMKDCRVWMYRGAWQEWDVAEEEMAVPLSPEEVSIKREAIYRHQSQKDRPLFPGTDKREFWLRAEERNHNTAVLFDKLGMAEYQAIELFVRYKFDKKY